MISGAQIEKPALALLEREPHALAEEAFALTRRQTLFWIDEQLFPDVPYHHVVLRLSLRGALDLERFRRAYADTLSAFDQFRLSFGTRGGEPCQRFGAQLNTALPLVDLSATPELLEDWIAERSARRFDFARALFEGALLKLADDHFVFYFCQHHVISDGLSVGLFVDDLAKRYRGVVPPERPSYARYLRSELAYRESPRAQRDRDYFEQRLAGGMPPLSLYGRTRESRTFGYDRSQLTLGQERSAGFAELVKDPRFELLDPAMSRLSALATLLFAYLYRVGGARTLVIATPVPNRSAEFASTGGLLMEQTFLRVEIDDDETFCTLADKVRRELFGALRHARHCLSDRGLSYVTLNLLRLPTPEFAGLDARLSLAPVASMPGQRVSGDGDLRDTLGVHVIGFDEHEPLSIGFDFHRATFDSALQARAKGHFLALFDALLRDPEATLDAIELVGPEERAELCVLGRGAEPSTPAPDMLLRLREVAAARAAEPAIRGSGRKLSYGELVEEVGRLATRLSQLGVKRGSRVAFCTPRGPDEPLAMLASWVLGAAYVPLDPSHPAERSRLILEDAAPELLITHAELRPRLQVPFGIEVLLIDQERAAIAQLPAQPLAAPADPEDAAYVLFTSGSTGRPKGVEVSRRSVANFLRSMAHTPGLTPADRLLAVTTSTFDIALLELLLPLYVGAQVQIAERETVLDPYLLRETLEREGISVLQATPTTWRMLLEAGFGQRPKQLKMLCGGEAISRALADKLLASGGELWNMYGPTETTVWSTVARLARDGAPITIGRPIDATQIYVLSPRGALSPLGVTGELCIAGQGVARGYFQRPELTHERFVPNPHGPAGDVAYRTGDLARYTGAGELECLGRLDHQVKVRGFRIELGEIEACLRAAPGVREVIVHAVGSREDPRLVGYYVGAGDAEPALRQHARERLPSYMQPSAYVALAELPLNTNGKVDRNKLPVPAQEPARVLDVHSSSSTLEMRMAGLFEELLGRADLPPDRDFFSLGGDSVRAMQLRRRIHETFHVELPLSILFDAPTVESLVQALRTKNLRPTPLFLQLRPGLRDSAPLICVMGIALYRDLARALDTDRAVYGVHVPLERAGAGRRASVEEIARAYTELILARVPEGPYHLAGLCFGGLVAFEIAHQLLRLGHEVRTLAVFDGLLPRGARYVPVAHLRALARDPRRIVPALRARAQRWLARTTSAPEDDGEGEFDLVLQGPEAIRLTHDYDTRAQRLPIPFMLFRASTRQEAPWYRLDAELGWGALGSPVVAYRIPGSHVSILQAGHVKAIAEPLSQQLAEEPSAGRRSKPAL